MVSMEEMVSYCNQYGFVFQGSELYGGLANTWDYGPMGARLKNNLKDAWRYFFIQNMDNSFELDADILMNPTVWEASGHLASFSDPLVDCKRCNTRHRVDTLISEFDGSARPDSMEQDEQLRYIRDNRVPCPRCGASDFTDIRQFNLMFATRRGVSRDSALTIYLRPENAQGEYVNFLNVLRTMRVKLPFSVGQIGKAFRNEITPKNFIFRTIEFEQMEFQTFCRPGDDEELYRLYKGRGLDFFRFLGLDESRLRYHDHEKLAHYAKAACDIDYRFPFGWGEINGTHNRTDFDLGRHQEFTGKNLTCFDERSGERFIPYIIESTYGVGRIFLALLFQALEEEPLDNGDKRTVLRISPFLAPIKVNVLPLVKKRHGERAREIQALLRRQFMTSYDDAGSIGKRYRRGDAVGTPFAVTVDDSTLDRGVVTLRERDSMGQITLGVDELVPYIGRAVSIFAGC